MTIVTAAVQHNGLALEHAPEEMKGDIRIVMAAVQQNWLALKFVSEEMKNNERIVLAAVQFVRRHTHTRI